MKQKLDIMDLQDYQFISALQPSPDREKCVFFVHQMDLEQNGYHSKLYLYQSKENQIMQLTGQENGGSAVWLDNETVLFQGKKESGKDAEGTAYYALPVSGGEPSFYMRIPADVSWIHPLGGRRFAVLAKSYLPDSGAPIPSASLSSTVKAKDEDYVAADEMPFRWDGIGIKNGMRSRCFVYDAGKRTLEPVSGEYQQVETISGKDGKVIYSARRFEKNSRYLDYYGVEVYDDHTGKREQLLDENTFRIYYTGFVGDRPAFAGTKGLLHGIQNENSSFYCWNGTSFEEFCHNERSTDNTVGTDVRWSLGPLFDSDKGGIYYVGTEMGNAYLKYAGTDGTIRQLSREEGTVDGFAVLADRILYVGMHDCGLQELYVLQQEKASRVSSLNQEILAQRTVSPPQRLLFTHAGYSMDGYVIKPVDYEPDQTYPALLCIHGGHKCAYGPVFFHDMQVWANRGFFLLYCNPRGSDGQDNAFADVIGHYGFYEEEDLKAFLDQCLSLYPQIDRERLGVWGGSYGGFLTNWMISRTNLFRCGVSERGIASWLTMFFTSDTGYMFPCWEHDTDVWRDSGRYWEHSPLKYAEHCKTPTLFICSEEDYRCPISEGVSMFYALQYHGVESRLCIFHGESHGLSRSGKPRSRIKRIKEITAWLERHLKEEGAEAEKPVELQQGFGDPSLFDE